MVGKSRSIRQGRNLPEVRADNLSVVIEALRKLQPISRSSLADATGLTAVHVNRTLKQLRDDGLVDTRDGRATVLDARRLKTVARFDAAYLHLDRTEGHEGAVADRAGDLV